MEFFPPESLDASPNLHVVYEHSFGPHLSAMEEMPLYPPADDQPLSYRLLYLPAWFTSSVVRLHRAGKGWRAICKQIDRRGDNEPGQLIGARERELSRKEALRLDRLLDRLDFWAMPPSEGLCGLDGFTAVLEGAEAGRYHVVHRWTPHGTPFAVLVDFLLGFCRGLVQTRAEPPKYFKTFAALTEALADEPDKQT
jgi:hypothetical protein